MTYPQQPQEPGSPQQSAYSQGAPGGQQFPPAPYPDAAPGQPGMGPGRQEPAGRPQRPGTVLTAAVMTFVGAGLMVLVGLVMLAGASSDSFTDSFSDSAGLGSISSGALAGLGVFFALLGITLIVLAAYALRGRSGARIGLTVIGGFFILMQAISVFALGASGAAIGLVWVAIAISLLWRPDASAWFRSTQP